MGLARAVLAALWIYFLIVGFMGLDFGVHWDESYHVRAVKHCIDTLTWFPQAYIYNGVYTLVGLPFVLIKAAPFIPRLLREMTSPDMSQLDHFATAPAAIDLQRLLRDYVDSQAYLLRVRGLCLAISSLAIPWVYLAACALRPRRRGAALAGAAFLALSWEFGYHARFIAADALMTQFAALELWLFLRAWTADAPPRARGWAVGAAAAAACAFACKTTGIFLVLPLMALVLRPGLSRDLRLKTAVAMAGVCAAVAFLLSPGTFLDPFRYLSAMAYEARNYNSHIPSAYLVTGFFDHASRAAVWLLWVVPSPFRAVTILFLPFIAAGGVDRLRRGGAVRVWAACTALFFVFVASNHMLLVRNFLPVLPLLAVLFAAGLHRAAERPGRWWRRGLWTAVTVGFAFNAAWGLYAAATIRRATPQTVLDDFRRHVVRERGPFRLSPRLADALGPALIDRLNCRVAVSPRAPAQTPRVVYLFWEHFLLSRHEINNRVNGLAVFYGPLDVNYDWYITFFGKMKDQRIVGLSWERANAISLSMDGYRDCEVR